MDYETFVTKLLDLLKIAFFFLSFFNKSNNLVTKGYFLNRTKQKI